MYGFTKETEPRLSHSEHEVWRDFIETRCGLCFGPTRARYLRQCLWSRMRILGKYNYGEYFHYITNHHAAEPEVREEEWLALLELLVIRESSFFRHRPSYQALAEWALPDLISRKRRAGLHQLRLWSAGCAAGQEPYSMLMTVLERVDPRTWRLEVVGSDISRQAISKARTGAYKEHEIRSLPDAFREKYTRNTMEPTGNRKQIRDEVKRWARFEMRNLLDSGEPLPDGWDIIFCQNLFIYLRPPMRERLFQRLCQSLSLGGYLFLAPAEILGVTLPGIQLQRPPETLIHKRVS